MSEHTDTGVPPALPDAFAAVLALIELAVDPKAVQARLSELKAAKKAIEEARIDVDLAKQAAEKEIAAAWAKVAAERAEIAGEGERWKELNDQQEARVERFNALVAENSELRRRLDNFIGKRDVPMAGGMVQSFSGHDPDDEPEFETSSHTEQVPGVPSLSRTIITTQRRPKPRSLRRVNSTAEL